MLIDKSVIMNAAFKKHKRVMQKYFELETKSVGKYLSIKHRVDLDISGVWCEPDGETDYVNRRGYTEPLKSVYIEMLWVPVNKHGRGIGSRVLTDLKKWALRRNCFLYLRTASAKQRDSIGTTSREDLIRFYKRNGFINWGIAENMMMWSPCLDLHDLENRKSRLED